MRVVESMLRAGLGSRCLAKSYRPVLRDQPMLLPVDLREWLPQDHLVWFVLDTVEALDYVTRRTAEGKTSREIKRCLARYVARDLYRLLEHPATRLDEA